jgi:hypothetical protein
MGWPKSSATRDARRQGAASAFLAQEWLLDNQFGARNQLKADAGPCGRGGAVPYRSRSRCLRGGQIMTEPASSHPTLERMARRVIDANKYMTLATADDAGMPWASPVYYTPEGYDVFYWASSPDSVHSRNLAGRPELSIVIFDSQVPIGAAEAVYMVASADIVPDVELERCAAAYGSRFPELREFAPDELRAPAELRLYRARVAEHSVLVRGGDPEFGRGVDTRVVVSL